MQTCTIELLESRTLFSATTLLPAMPAAHRGASQQLEESVGQSLEERDVSGVVNNDNIQQGPGDTGSGGGATDGTSQSLVVVRPAAGRVSASSAGALVPAFVGSIPSSLLTGKAIKVPLVVRLTNQAPKVEKGLVTIRLFASATPAPGSTDTQLLSVTKKLVIRPGKSNVVKLKLTTLPASLAMGNYFLLAQLTDPSGGVGTAATRTAIRIAPPFVSLQFAFAGPAPATLAQGDTATASLTVKNVGTDLSTAPVLIAFSLAKTATPGPNDLTLSKLTKKLRLKGNTSTSIKANISVPMSIPLGTYFLVVKFNGSNPIVSPNSLTVTVGGM